MVRADAFTWARKQVVHFVFVSTKRRQQHVKSRPKSCRPTFQGGSKSFKK